MRTLLRVCVQMWAGYRLEIAWRKKAAASEAQMLQNYDPCAPTLRVRVKRLA